MKCPICVEKDLVMSERMGIEIDYCPNCRGVWLDRGELDKIIEKSGSDNEPDEKNSTKRNDADNRKYDKPYRDENNRYSDGYYKKKKSAWGELFDF